MKELWPEDRRWELTRFQELLREIGSINSSTGALDHLLRVIHLADDLSREDFTTPRKSFLSFLEDQATGR